MHSSHHLWLPSIVALAAWSAPLAPAGAAEPTIVLAPGWYRIVEPFHYDEARRFERGWNRGADVVPGAGGVRAPLSGVVRFAGTIAGRRVLTVLAQVGGMPIVVTFTGMSVMDVSAGDRVAVGQRLGSARLLHLGAYDLQRRSRYLPVVAGRDSSPVSTPSNPLAAGVASRLLRAIDGDAQLSAARAAAPRVPTRDAGSGDTNAARLGRRPPEAGAVAVASVLVTDRAITTMTDMGVVIGEGALAGVVTPRPAAGAAVTEAATASAAMSPAAQRSLTAAVASMRAPTGAPASVGATSAIVSEPRPGASLERALVLEQPSASQAAPGLSGVEIARAALSPIDRRAQPQPQHARDRAIGSAATVTAVNARSVLRQATAVAAAPSEPTSHSKRARSGPEPRSAPRQHLGGAVPGAIAGIGPASSSRASTSAASSSHPPVAGDPSRAGDASSSSEHRRGERAGAGSAALQVGCIGVALLAAVWRRRRRAARRPRRAVPAAIPMAPALPVLLPQPPMLATSERREDDGAIGWDLDPWCDDDVSARSIVLEREWEPA